MRSALQQPGRGRGDDAGARVGGRHVPQDFRVRKRLARPEDVVVRPHGKWDRRAAEACGERVEVAALVQRRVARQQQRQAARADGSDAAAPPSLELVVADAGVVEDDGVGPSPRPGGRVAVGGRGYVEVGRRLDRHALGREAQRRAAVARGHAAVAAARRHVGADEVHVPPPHGRDRHEQLRPQRRRQRRLGPRADDDDARLVDEAELARVRGEGQRVRQRLRHERARLVRVRHVPLARVEEGLERRQVRRRAGRVRRRLQQRPRRVRVRPGPDVERRVGDGPREPRAVNRARWAEPPSADHG
mmetsp:Transcript_17724/g.60851  ORF Transcript_17724/g.60851 Transcript_17724/m.60851 type:complete len:303 (+) Transcript_17724:269-1177(+)